MVNAFPHCTPYIGAQILPLLLESGMFATCWQMPHLKLPSPYQQQLEELVLRPLCVGFLHFTIGKATSKDAFKAATLCV
jgi:hypothetical protein